MRLAAMNENRIHETLRAPTMVPVGSPGVDER